MFKDDWEGLSSFLTSHSGKVGCEAVVCRGPTGKYFPAIAKNLSVFCLLLHVEISKVLTLKPLPINE